MNDKYNMTGLVGGPLLVGARVPLNPALVTPNWAWPGSRDPISKFCDLITFEWKELSA